MANEELDNKILLGILKNLPGDMLNSIVNSFSSDPAQLDRLQEILGTSMEKTPEKEPDMNIRDRWENSKKDYKNRFNELIQKYLDAYLRGERKTEFEPSRATLENIVSNHSKWNRMINHHGQGRQYHDDIRRVCFVFQLTFPEANELMWSAGQLFDPCDLRDYIIIDCLQRQIYSMSAVDQLLLDSGVPELFPVD